MPTRLLLAALIAASLALPAAAQQVLKVGSTPTGVPFTFLNTKTNAIEGIMVDLITAVGKDAGFEVAIEPMQFSALIASLTSSKIDIIAAAMFATDARRKVIAFSDAVYSYGEGLFVPSTDTKDYVGFDDMKGYTVGVQVGTAFVEPLKKAFPEVKIYDTIPDMMRDVNAGRIQAGFADLPIVAYNLQLGNFPATRLVKSYKPTIPGSVAIGLRQSDTELLSKINTSLAKLKADGTLTKILAKWGLE